MDNEKFLLTQRDGVWYDSEYEMQLYDAVRSGDVKGASEALIKDPELAETIFGKDIEDRNIIISIEVLKEDINMGQKGMLCKVHTKEGVKYYFISPYIYDDCGAWLDSYCDWVVIPTAK